MEERHEMDAAVATQAGRQGEFDPFEEGERDPRALPGAEDAELVARARAESARAKCGENTGERIVALMDEMHADRRALLAILRACDAPCAAEPLAQAAREAQTGVSVYAPETLRRLLEEAGAIVRVNEDGSAYSAQEEEPKVVVVDGVECLEPSEAPVPYWVATPQGRAAVQADEPLSRIEELFEKKAEYLPIFKRVLTMCAEEGGVKTKQINAAVDSDPLVQKPRLFASYFTEQLEDCGALVWDGAWETTDTGLEALEMLADVKDEVACA